MLGNKRPRKQKGPFKIKHMIAKIEKVFYKKGWEDKEMPHNVEQAHKMMGNLGAKIIDVYNECK